MQTLPIKWKTEFVIVTPQDATKILEGNAGNRKLRDRVVDRYVAIITAGNWQLSPQPIIIADTGRVLDGQHRLVAVERTGVPLPFTIISNVPESVFSILDRGAVRSTADALGIDQKLAEVAKAILECTHAQSRAPDHEVGEIAALLADDFAELLASCNTATRVFSSAPVRAAATVRLFAGYNRDFILKTYRGLVLGQMQELTASAQSMVAAVASGRIRTAGLAQRMDVLARAWDVFDETKSEVSRLQIKDPRTRTLQIKRIIDAARTPQSLAAE